MFNPDSVVRQPAADADSAYAKRENVKEYTEGLKRNPEIINHTSSYLDFIKRYREKGIDLEALYKTLRQSNHTEDIKSQFLNSREHNEFSQFAELLPLLANKEGRLGKICHARITKTAKPDDEGNSFVDLVCELSMDRQYLKENPDLADVKPSVTFLVDVTTSKDKFDAKEAGFRKHSLSQGKKDKVLCYENPFRVLGVEAPKCLVLKQEDQLASFAKEIRAAVHFTNDGSFRITNDKFFDQKYVEFFTSFVESVEENAKKNSDFINEQPNRSRELKDLVDTYQSLDRFLGAYKKALGAG